MCTKFGDMGIASERHVAKTNQLQRDRQLCPFIKWLTARELFMQFRPSSWAGGTRAACLLLLAVSLSAACASTGRTADRVRSPITAQILEVHKIWDQAPHNAFTDLTRFGDAWYCAFREGQAHMSADGKLRVLRSANGERWESAALLDLPGYDLRDAGVSTMPDGRLMLLGGATVVGPPRGGTGTLVSFSRDGNQWTTPQIVLEPGRWLWKTTWHGGKAYGVAYGSSARAPSALVVSDNGIAFHEQVGKLLDADGRATEARVRFDEAGEAYCLHRRDDSPNTAMLGRAAAPFTDWQWSDLGAFLGGPNFLQTPHGEWVAVGRLLDGGARTSVVWLDVEHGAMIELARLPSGGDTSYPGLVWHDDTLWVSYYSSHEARTSIYLAKLKIVPRGSSGDGAGDQ
jgi:hypothetical protein